MRGMSSSLTAGSSPFHSMSAVASLSHVLPPSVDRLTKMPLAPGPCPQYDGRPFFWIHRNESTALPLSSNASDGSPPLRLLPACGCTAVNVRPPSVEYAAHPPPTPTT